MVSLIARIITVLDIRCMESIEDLWNCFIREKQGYDKPVSASAPRSSHSGLLREVDSGGKHLRRGPCQS